MMVKFNQGIHKDIVTISGDTRVTWECFASTFLVTRVSEVIQNSKVLIHQVTEKSNMIEFVMYLFTHCYTGCRISTLMFTLKIQRSNTQTLTRERQRASITRGSVR